MTAAQAQHMARAVPELAGRGLWFVACFGFGALSMALSLTAGWHVHESVAVMAIFMAAGVLCELIEMMVPLRARRFWGWVFAVLVLLMCAVYQTYAGFQFLDKVMLRSAKADEAAAIRRQADVSAFQTTRAAVVATKAQRDPDEIAAEMAAILAKPLPGGLTVGQRTNACGEPGRAPEPCRTYIDLKSEHAAAQARRRNEAALKEAAAAVAGSSRDLAGRTEGDGGLVPALVAWVGRTTGLPVRTGGDMLAVLLVAVIKIASLMMPIAYRFSRAPAAPVPMPAPLSGPGPAPRAEPVRLALAPASGVPSGPLSGPDDTAEGAVRTWIESRTALAPASRMQATEAWHDYLDWADARGLPNLSQRDFGRTMTTLGMARDRYGKRSINYYIGVELRPLVGGAGRLVEIQAGGRA